MDAAQFIAHLGRARTDGTAQTILAANRRGIATASHQAAKPWPELRIVLGSRGAVAASVPLRPRGCGQWLPEPIFASRKAALMPASR